VQRQAAGDSEITLDTRIITLVDQHIDRLQEDGRSIRTIDTYRYCAKLLAKIIAGVRVGEATAARLDAAIRSMRRAHGNVMAVQRSMSGRQAMLEAMRYPRRPMTGRQAVAAPLGVRWPRKPLSSRAAQLETLKHRWPT
jgi:hypothetical protein